MVQRRGPRLAAAQKAELWRRWREGESLNAIGRALGRIPKMVRYVVAGAGGIPPVPRQRAHEALALSEHGHSQNPVFLTRGHRRVQTDSPSLAGVRACTVTSRPLKAALPLSVSR